MEQQPAAEPSTIARGHNAVHVLPADWSLAPVALGRALDRVNPDAAGTQLLVIVADADAAVGVTQAIIGARAGVGPRVVAATGADRTARVLRAGAAPVVVGAPTQLVGLLRAAAMKLDTVGTLAVAWVDEVLMSGSGEDLETVLAEVPKDAARIIVAGALSPQVEDFIERHARRAPRIGLVGDPVAGPSGADAPRSTSGHAPDGPEQQPPVVSYVLAAPAARPEALRRVLDEIDPPSASIYVRTDASERVVGETLLALGYHGSAAPVRVVRGEAGEHTALVVLYDVPHTPAEWGAATGGRPARVVALVLPRQLTQLQTVTGSPIAPISFAAPLDIARAQEAALRAQLRRELSSGTPARELLALEPLLADFDGVALAAAALRMLERERRSRTPADASRPPALASAPAAGPTERGAARSAPPRRDKPGHGGRPELGPKGARNAPRDHGPGAYRGGSGGRTDRDPTTRRPPPGRGTRDVRDRGPAAGPSRPPPGGDAPTPRDTRPLPRNPR